MGWKGIIIFISGMTLMTILIMHPKTSMMIQTILSLIGNETELYKNIKGENDEEKYIEIKMWKNKII